MRCGIGVSASGLVLISLCVSSIALAQTPQRLAVVRVGDGSTTLSNASQPVFIDEFSLTGGNPLTSIALPIAEGANGAAPLTLSGSATSEGSLRRSSNGHYLTLGGYGTAPGLASVAATTSAAVNRVVGRVDANGSVDTTTRMANAYSGNNIRGAISDDGTRFWTTGTAATNGGVQFVPLGAGAANVELAATPTNVRVPGIFASQLFFTSASGAFVGLSSLGSGLPTSAGQTATLLPGFPGAGSPSPYAFVLFDLDATVPGLDTAYVADDRAPASGGGVQKWRFDGATWTLLTTFAPPGGLVGARGITGSNVGTTVTLYATTAETTANTLVSLIDDGSLAPVFNVLATSPANTVFRGVDFAPTAVVVAPATPSFALWPAALLFAGLGVLVLRTLRKNENALG